MTWTLNGDPAPRDESSGWLLINDVQYPPDWPFADLEALGLTWEPPAPEPVTLDQLCTMVDVERDRLAALDFVYDFGPIQAINDQDETIEAGVRALQMRDQDVKNWMALYSVAAVSVMTGGGDAIMPMRAEDNWNIQTTATQVLGVLSAVFSHVSGLTFYGGALKSALRAAEDPTLVAIYSGWPAGLQRP